MADGSSTELLRGIVYLQFKNVAMFEDDVDWARDAWLRDFINDLNELYEVYYEQPQGTIPYIWLKNHNSFYWYYSWLINSNVSNIKKKH